MERALSSGLSGGDDPVAREGVMVFGYSFLALRAWHFTPCARVPAIAAAVSIILSAIFLPSPGLAEPSSPRHPYAGATYVSVSVSVPAEMACGSPCRREVAAQFVAHLREQIKLEVHEAQRFGLNSETEPGILFVQIAVGFNPEAGSGAVVLSTEPALAPPARAVFLPAQFEASSLYENGALAPSLKDTLFKLAKAFAPYTSTTRREYEKYVVVPHTGAEWNILVRSDGDDPHITDTVCAVAPEALAMHRRLGNPNLITCVAEIDDTSKNSVFIVSASKNEEHIAIYVEAIVNKRGKARDICPLPLIFASLNDFRRNIKAVIADCALGRGK